MGIPYRPDQPENDIFAIGEGVRKKYEEILVPAGMGDVAIYTEMGRYMLGSLRLSGDPGHPSRSTLTRSISAWTPAPPT